MQTQEKLTITWRKRTETEQNRSHCPRNRCMPGASQEFDCLMVIVRKNRQPAAEARAGSGRRILPSGDCCRRTSPSGSGGGDLQLPLAHARVYKIGSHFSLRIFSAPQKPTAEPRSRSRKPHFFVEKIVVEIKPAPELFALHKRKILALPAEKIVRKIHFIVGFIALKKHFAPFAAALCIIIFGPF